MLYAVDRRLWINFAEFGYSQLNGFVYALGESQHQLQGVFRGFTRDEVFEEQSGFTLTSGKLFNTTPDAFLLFKGAINNITACIFVANNSVHSFDDVVEFARVAAFRAAGFRQSLSYRDVAL